MPAIPEYTAQVTRLQTQDRAIDAKGMAARQVGRLTNEVASEFGDLGRRIGGTISQVGNAVEDYQAHKEISAGSLKTTQMLLAAQNTWNETVKSSDPNDPTVQGKFLDKLEESFGQLRDGFSTRRGQEWAERRVEQMRSHFAQTTTADMSTLAGIAAHNNFVQSTNMLTALVDKDPSALKMAVGMVKDNVDSVASSSPTLKGVSAEKFRTEATQRGMEAIIKTAVQASIRRGGDGSEITNNPEYAPYINAQERQQFLTQMRQEQRAAAADARMARLEEKQQRQEASDQNLDRIVRNLYDPSPDTKRVTAKDIVAIPDTQISVTAREHALKLVEARASGEVINPNVAKVTAMQLIVGIHEGRVNEDAIYKAAADNKLDEPRLKQVLDAYKGRLTSDTDTLRDRRSQFMSQYGAVVNPSDALGQKQESGHLRQFNLYDAAVKQEKRLQQAGKNPADAYDPRSPDFVGKLPEAQPPNPALLMMETKERAAAASKTLKPDQLQILKQYPDAKVGTDGQMRVVRNGVVMIVKP